MDSPHVTAVNIPVGSEQADADTRPLRISRHAIERYQQRVEPGSSLLAARLRLGQMVALGRTRATPRHWMRGQVSLTPGLRFLYWAQRPNLCALVMNDVVITVLTR